MTRTPLVPRKQHGFAVIAGIFLIVVLAALAGFMVTFSNTQQLTSAQDVQGSRAYWAARAGLEWGVTTSLAAALPCAASTTTPLGTVEGFTVSVTVRCNNTPYSEAGKSVYIFRIVSTASAGAPGSAGYVERSVSATLER